MTRALRGLTWDHPRGIDPLVAASADYERETGVRVEWASRPLSSFEDDAADGLAPDCDLLAIDHPSIGDAQRAGALLPLDGLVAPEQLADRAADSVGAAHASYRWLGHQWALAIDAACMVSARRSDLVRPEEPLEPRRVLLPANPTHLFCTLLSLRESIATDDVRLADGRPSWWPDTGPDLTVEALRALRELLARCSPDSLRTDPIEALDRLVSDDEIAYVPLVFQYVTYALDPSHRATFTPFGSRGTLTGGVGLAVSAASENPEASADFAVFASSRATQSGIFAAAGGQPARESAWLDQQVNSRTGDFFSSTLPAARLAFLRPRLPGYPAFQAEAATALHAMVLAAEPERAIAAELAALWKRHVLTA